MQYNGIDFDTSLFASLDMSSFIFIVLLSKMSKLLSITRLTSEPFAPFTQLSIHITSLSRYISAQICIFVAIQIIIRRPEV